VAGRILHKAQSTFVQGKNIMNSILALHEVLHETKRKKQTGVILKLDFEKAYDKVHWGFLLRCLKERGFSNTWCDWMNQILKNGTVAVKINNCIGPYFQSHKGSDKGILFLLYYSIWWLTALLGWLIGHNRVAS
jgi:hypothetical protein